MNLYDCNERYEEINRAIHAKTHSSQQCTDETYQVLYDDRASGEVVR